MLAETIRHWTTLFEAIVLLTSTIAPNTDAVPVRPPNFQQQSVDDYVDPTIISGEPTGRCTWPWMVALTTEDRRFVCGASLIRNQWLVTAAHCVYNATVDLYANIGAYNLTIQDEVNRIQISDIIVNEGYSPFRYGFNDVALLRLSTPVQVNSSTCVETINLPLPGYDAVNNPNCYIIGWGRTGYEADAGISDVLTQKNADVITNEVCQSRWNKSLFGSPTIYAQNVCIDEKNDISACQGDSGSPLQCYVDGRGWTIVGVSSWGSGACRWYPSVYMRVSDYDNWIIKQIAMYDPLAISNVHNDQNASLSAKSLK